PRGVLPTLSVLVLKPIAAEAGPATTSDAITASRGILKRRVGPTLTELRASVVKNPEGSRSASPRRESCTLGSYLAGTRQSQGDLSHGVGFLHRSGVPRQARLDARVRARGDLAAGDDRP